MNIAVKTLNPSALSPVFLSWSISIKHQILLWVLAGAVLFSAFGVVYARDVSRQLMGDLQVSQESYHTLRTEWSQLLLEEGVWSSRARIEKIAKKRKMIVPSARLMVK